MSPKKTSCRPDSALWSVVPAEEWVDEVVRDRVEDVSVDRLRRAGDLRHRVRVVGNRLHDALVDRAGVYGDEEAEPDERGDERGEHGAGERLGEDLPHRVALAEGRHRGEDRERDCRNRHELERPRVGGRDEVHEVVQRRNAESSKYRAHDERGRPYYRLLEFH